MKYKLKIGKRHTKIMKGRKKRNWKEKNGKRKSWKLFSLK